MKASILFALLCGLIAGVFLGIWMDWSVPRHQHITYQLQEFPQANLQVYPGDQITLSRPDGTSNDLQMNFGGLSPCANQQPSNPCVIAADVLPGPYNFICNSGSSNGNSCPDPGIQPSPTGPGPLLSLGKAVSMDFSHLFGAREHIPMRSGNPAQPQGPSASDETATTAFVSCPNGTTVLQGRNQQPLTSITTTVGQTVYWASPLPFSMTTTSFPAGFCKGGNPGGSNLHNASCEVTMPVQNLQYSVQAQLPATCNSLPATLTATPTTKK